MFSNILSGAAGFPVADLGDEISQSLRFRGSQTLTNTNISTSGTGNLWTLSLWVKYTDPSQHSTQIFKGDDGSNSQGFISLNTSGSTNLGEITFNFGTGGNGFVPKKKFRDPNAWYHFIIIYNGANQNINVWINGEAVTEDQYSGSTMSTGVIIDQVVFGKSGAKCYLADVHFIDGSAKAKTDFGKYQEDGVWVPKNYTGTYGTNGFHLDFADSSNPGNDVSGNNNDFTASGFDTSPVGLYSPGLTANSGGSIVSVGNAFDGVTAYAAYVSPTGIGMTFVPPKDIPFTTLEIFPSNNNMSATFDGTTTNTPTLQYTQVATNGTINSTTPLTINVGSGLNCNLNAIRINGTTILKDNTDNDVDYLDTPTSNFATYNSLATPTTASRAHNFQRANLGMSVAAASGIPLAASSQSIPANDANTYYCEVELISGNLAYAIGVGSSTESLNNYDPAGSGGTTKHITINNNGHVFNGSVLRTGAHSQTTASGVFSIIYNSSTRKVSFKVNGNTLTFSGAAAGDVDSDNAFSVPADWGDIIFIPTGYTTDKVFVNYGQMPFLYTPPTGAKKLQTNNLPEPTIKNGKEHFGVVTYTGNSSARSITGLEFQPDFVWIKCRNNTYNNNLFDSVRGATTVLYSDLPDKENSNAQTLTSFDTNGFSLGTNSGVNASASSETFVAWCWKAGGTAGLNEAGSINSQVSANTDAGFSIVSYFGNDTLGATVGHGLNSAPEFMLVKNREETAGRKWSVYHKYIDATAPEDKYLHLNTADSVADSVDRWNDTAPTSTVFSLGDSGESNATDEFIAYCWHSVKGFSKFGSYVGNGSFDGTLVYLGFKPALIILKSSSSAFDWQIYDSTRSPTNPALLTLRPNQPNSEVTSGNDLDILSNGFKARDNGSINNNSNSTYLYMAWAEHPFGGENAAPATAR